MQRPTTAKPFSFDFKLLRAACIVLLSAQVPALVATLPLGLHAPAATAQTQSAEAVAKVAQAITVRIEGATQGSGVLVKKEGNRYTVLTAWHVVSGQRPGEELDIFTSDGQRHLLEAESIQQVGSVDMATLTFLSGNDYRVASIEGSASISRGNPAVVAGFPLGKNGRIIVSQGVVLANADMGIDNGYQLIYTSQTEPGMSGGPVLDSHGKLIAIHGRGELDSMASNLISKAIKTGANQGVPIKYLFKNSSDSSSENSNSRPQTSDDYFAQARAIAQAGVLDDDIPVLTTVVKLLGRSIDILPTSEAYLYRAQAKRMLKDASGSLNDLEMAFKLNPLDYRVALSLAYTLKERGRINDAIQLVVAYLERNIQTIPADDAAFVIRDLAEMGERSKAMTLIDEAIRLNPKSMDLLETRSIMKKWIGDHAAAVADLKEASQYGFPLLAEQEVIYLIRMSEGIKGVINYYDTIISREPTNSGLYYSMRAFARKEAGDAKGFYSDIVRYFTLSDKRPSDHVTLSKAKLDIGDRDGALQQLKIAVQSLRHEKESYEYRIVSDAQAETGDIQGAIDTLNLAIQRFPQDSSIYTGRARLRKYKLNDRKGAIDDYATAAKLSKYDGLDVSFWASTVEELYYESFDERYIYEAIGIYDVAIANRPREAYHYLRRAQLKTEVNDLLGALDDLDKAVVIDNRHHKERAEVLLALGRNAEAASDLEQAIALLSSNDPFEYISIAEILHGRLRQTQKAMRLLDAGISNNQGGEHVDKLYSGRAEIRLDMGDMLGACIDHRKAISINKENTVSAEWLQSRQGAMCR